MWGVSGAFLGVYSIVQDLNIPLILQPQLFGVLSFVSWGQVSRSWSVIVTEKLKYTPSVSIMATNVPEILRL